MDASVSSDPRFNAEDYNKTGCELYVRNLFDAALSCYNHAIQLNHSNYVYYFNRCACFMKLLNYTAALDDARSSLKIKSTYVKAYQLQTICLISLGELKAAKSCIETIKQLDKNNSFAKKKANVLKKCFTSLESYENSMKSNNLISALDAIDNALQYSKYSIRFKLMKADVLVAMKRYEEAERIVCDILLMDDKNDTAYYIRGKIHCLKGHLNSAISDFEASLKLSSKLRVKIEPMLKNAKLCLAKSQASDAIGENDLNKSFKLYSEALQIDPTNDYENAKLYFNRSIVTAKLQNIKEAIDNCSKAIELNPNYLKAYLRRAQLCRDLKRFDESVRDYVKIVKMEPFEEEYSELLEATRKEWNEWLESQAEQETLQLRK